MEDIDYQSDIISQKIRHFLISNLGKTADEANAEEFYRAFASAIREEIMVNWTATHHTYKTKKIRRLYYLSMEYMPGRLLSNNITNIHAQELMYAVLKKMKRQSSEIIHSERDIGIGNGGLGRLASCLLDSLATHEYPAMGYGLRYQYGIFEQQLWCGVQLERPDCWLLTQNPWEFRRDSNAVGVKYAGRLLEGTNAKGEQAPELADYEEVRALPYDIPIIGYSKDPDFPVLTLRLWTTKESPRNFLLQRYNAGQIGPAAENASLTDVLYPNDNHEIGKKIRLKQEFLLVSASLQDIIHQHLESYENMQEFADKTRIQINDTHAALSIAELLRILIKNYDYTWEQAFETVQTVFSYTNHTVMKEALEEWNEQRMQSLLPRQYSIIQEINGKFCGEIRKHFPNDEEKLRRMSIIGDGQIKMAHLCIYGGHHINGVAALHTEILKHSVFSDFYDLYPEKFINVTNGVTQRRWVLNANPLLAEFLTSRIGDGWIKNLHEIHKIKDYANDPKSQEEFLKIKAKNKRQMLLDLATETQEHQCGLRPCYQETFLDETALFDVQIKRFHEYKRQLMNALHTLILYHDFLENPKSHPIKRLVIFGGKAAPGYHMAKNILRLIYCLARKINHDERVNEKLKIVFIENYNVSRAEMIIPATDLSEQISTAGLEASGTGNMKFALNGALTIGTDDGANVEMRESITDEWWPFKFGQGAKDNFEMRQQHSYDPHKIIDAHPKIAKALEALQNQSLTENEAEHETLLDIYRSLTVPSYGGFTDIYFVMNDLPSYLETQEKVEELFVNPHKWAEYVLHNIGGMGKFSTDESIQNYANKIWELQPCPLDPQELARVRQEYSEHDRCRILNSSANHKK